MLTERAGSSPGSSPVHELTLQALARPEAVPQLRHHARAALTAWGLTSIAGTAELVSTELVTNAIVASGAQPIAAPIGLHLAAYPGRLVVMVRDASPGAPRPQPLEDDAVSGRGLQIIEKLSADWAASPSPTARARSSGACSISMVLAHEMLSNALHLVVVVDEARLGQAAHGDAVVEAAVSGNGD